MTKFEFNGSTRIFSEQFVRLTFQVYETGFDNMVALMGHSVQSINVTDNKATSLRT